MVSFSFSLRCVAFPLFVRSLRFLCWFVRSCLLACLLATSWYRKENVRELGEGGGRRERN